MIRVFSAFVSLARLILLVNKRKTNLLFTELNAQLKPHGFALSTEHKKRIFFYTAQSAITNHWFTLLRGKKATQQEQKTALYLGAFTPIADDLMDSSGLKFEALIQHQKDDSADAILFAYLLEKLAPQRSLNPYFKDYFIKAHAAQNESLKQLENQKLSIGELKQISFNKGGYYTLLYRFVLNHKPLPSEEDAIYTLGSILQVLNDLFDIYKDYHNGVQTLVTNSANMPYIRSVLEELESTLKTQLMDLSYPERNKQKALISIMAIVTRGHVALAHYNQLQGNAKKLDIGKYARKPLIVDMEKPGNVWRNLKATNAAIG